MDREQAEKIVEKLIRDITSRSGIGNEYESIDEDIQEEMKETWIDIIINTK